MKNYITLEFNEILKQLADKAQSHLVKARCLALVPSLNEAEVIRRLDETTQTKRIIEQIGTPPLPTMTDLQKIIDLIDIDEILSKNKTCAERFHIGTAFAMRSLRRAILRH